MTEKLGLAGRMANRLADSPLVPLFVVACLVLGAYSLRVTPREDRPDIQVPTAMVVLPWPGGGTERVDNQLARRAATWVRQLTSVTEIRSSSTDHAALLMVEFEAGTAETTAFSELDELFQVYAEHLPVGAGPPRIETFGEERLVVFLATLSSKTQSPLALERIAGELSAQLESVPGVRSISRYGGDQEAVEVLPRLEAMTAYGVAWMDLAQALAVAGRNLPVGMLEAAPVVDVQAGIDIGSLEKLAHIPVGQAPTGPVYLEEVAAIRAGTVHQNQAVLHWQRGQSVACPAVTIAATTLAGQNVADVTRRIQARITSLAADLIPADVQIATTYDAGTEATHRVYTVLRQLLSAILIVVGIIWLGLGWRAALIIAMMMPVSLAIVPFLYNQFGFTLNPISIASMILAIGILSDDVVVMLENVSRTFREAGKKSRALTVRGVDEVGNPTILADLLVVATLLPTAYITGKMGQYVRALPVGASAAVLFSLLVALMITPYFGLRLLKVKPKAGDRNSSADGQPEAAPSEQGYARLYRAVMGCLMQRSLVRWGLYGVLLLLLLGSVALVAFRRIQIGLTPLLDRQVFAVQIELPAGATLTQTLTASSSISQKLRAIPEVASLTVYAGTQAPLLYPPSGTQLPAGVRPHQAILHVQMTPEAQRQRLSYEISRQVARELDGWLQPYQADGYIGRIPSGPSRDRAVTAEIYGPDAAAREALAERVARLLRAQPGVVTTDQYPDESVARLNIWVDPQRAATHAVNPAAVTETLLLAIEGRAVTDWPVAGSRDPVPVILRLEQSQRADAEALQSIYLAGMDGKGVPLQEVVAMQSQPGNPVRYRRDMLPVITVAADVDRSVSQPLTVQIATARALQAQAHAEGEGEGEAMDVRWLAPPGNTAQPQLYWSGEWEMTRDVYRDLGAAGAVVLLLIYLLLAGWFHSYTLPFLIMLPIPLLFIGVLPAHWLLGIHLMGTGVLGSIALAGIVARNSILLVDFIERREKEGAPLQEAVIRAGIQRTRPILLTAATVMFGSGVLVFEPSLKPLGLTLASGVLIATLLTLVLIPLLYFHTHNKRERRMTAVVREGADL